MRNTILSLLLISDLTQAGNLSSRMEEGVSALATPEGQRYEATWGPVIRTAITACVPLGAASPAKQGRFAFVGDVSPDGRVSAVEVLPSTEVSRCFAQHFTGALLPAPPLDLRRDIGSAWDISAGNGIRLLILLGGMPVILVLPLSSLVGMSPVLDVAVNFLKTIVAAFEIAILSNIYKYLSDADGSESNSF